MPSKSPSILTAAQGNPVNMFFANVLGLNVREHHRFRGRVPQSVWDVVIVQDTSSSYSADLSYAVHGHQALLADFNQYSPSSYLGVVQHTGWGSTWAALQPVGSNFSSLNTTIGKIADCSNNTTSAYNVYGGTATSIAVTTLTPACSGSDLATGIQQAINMFNSAAYTVQLSPRGRPRPSSFPPMASRMPVDNGQHPSSKYTDAQLNTLAQTTAAAAWAQGISVYVVFYYHGSDSGADTALLQSLVEGQGSFTQVTDADPGAGSARSTSSRDHDDLRGGAVSRGRHVIYWRDGKHADAAAIVLALSGGMVYSRSTR